MSDPTAARKPANETAPATPAAEAAPSSKADILSEPIEYSGQPDQNVRDQNVIELAIERALDGVRAELEGAPPPAPEAVQPPVVEAQPAGPDAEPPPEAPAPVAEPTQTGSDPLEPGSQEAPIAADGNAAEPVTAAVDQPDGSQPAPDPVVSASLDTPAEHLSTPVQPEPSAMPASVPSAEELIGGSPTPAEPPMVEAEATSAERQPDPVDGNPSTVDAVSVNSVTAASSVAAAVPMATPAPVKPVSEPATAAGTDGDDVDQDEPLSHALARLAPPASVEDLAKAVSSSGGKGMDQMVEDIMRPMVREWLANNLPTLAERLVREEIERISRKKT